MKRGYADQIAKENDFYMKPDAKVIDHSTPHAPKVSIGMPVYNGEPYLSEALSSLLLQSFTDFELIISDNCSTDRTTQIIEHYSNKDSRIVSCRQTENIGGIDNFQFVLDRASGEYFMWAAHDDKWGAEYIAQLVGVLDNFDDAIAAVGSIYNIFPYSTEQKKLDICVQNISASRLLRVFRYSFRECYPIYGLWRRKSLLSLPPFDGLHWADLPLLMAAAYRGKFRQCKDAKFYYRKINKSLDERLKISLNYQESISEVTLIMGCVENTYNSLCSVNTSKAFATLAAFLVGIRLYFALASRHLGDKYPSLRRIKKRLFT